ncbi:RmlC-like cupin [Exidia glandulosa HHB12029]|uniref:RmlC-like cupin n=1 Tax=Exidia glandulosa HHB12029 TaxID=1314781 RepID=A0A165LKU5_EXIGL|nr:RmlC-like cupin [Exidia glandulosa HHB12029]
MKSSILAAVSLALSAAATGSNADTLAALKKASTAVERISILGNDQDFVFNFIDPNKNQTSGAGGHTVSAAVNTFPALFGSGMAMTLGFMEPCSLNSPHTHPRATEILIMLNGTIKAGFLAENGARFIMNEVPTLSATVFPKGSIHFQANVGCKPVPFAAALSNEDPGTLQVAQRFFALPADVVGASLGGIGVQDVASLARLIPDNLIQATKECFASCGLTPPASGSQPTKQQSPPSATTTAAEHWPSSSPTQTGNGDYEGKGSPNNWVGVGQDNDTKPDWAHDASSTAKPVVNLAEAFDNAVDGTKGWFKHLDGTKIALIVLIALNVAFLIGAIVFLIARCVRKRKERRNGGLSNMPISGPIKPLFAGRSVSNRGKYAAAEFEMPIDDAASQDAILPRKFEDPYDKPPSRAPSPLPAAHAGPYRD